MDQALVFQIAQGVALAACAGMRAFLPLLVVGGAGRLGWVELSETFDWLSSTPALVVFGIAVVLEVLADKIPLVDNALDLAQFVIKPVAGTVVAASVMVDLTPLQATVVAVITGGVIADVVHFAKSKIRLFSSATTAGIGNPLLSAAEDGGSFVGSLLAIFVPLLLLLLVVAGLVALWLAARRLRLKMSRLDGP